LCVHFYVCTQNLAKNLWLVAVTTANTWVLGKIDEIDKYDSPKDEQTMLPHF